MCAWSVYALRMAANPWAGCDSKPTSPGPDFDTAVTRHRLLGMIIRASETGVKQIAQAV